MIACCSGSEAVGIGNSLNTQTPISTQTHLFLPYLSNQISPNLEFINHNKNFNEYQGSLLIITENEKPTKYHSSS
jgi:hypothetical protein